MCSRVVCHVAGHGDRDEVVTVAFDVDTGPAKHLHFLNVCFRNGFQVLLRLLSRAFLPRVHVCSSFFRCTASSSACSCRGMRVCFPRGNA
jgi:hypothetical protein